MIAGQAEGLPQLAILVDLLDQVAQETGAARLRRWARRRGRAGGGAAPIDLLLARDFAAFEDAVDLLASEGEVITGG